MAGKKESPETAGREKGAENKFSKEQLLSCERFRDRRDILNALLCDGELYAVKDAEEMIGKYMKGRVM